MLALAFAVALAAPSQPNVPYYKLVDLMKEIDSFEVKIFDTTTTASCPQCRGDLNERFDISIYRRCRFTCLTNESKLAKLLENSVPTQTQCEEYKIGKIIFRHGSGSNSLTIDYTGRCLSFGALNYRTEIDAVRYIIETNPVDF